MTALLGSRVDVSGVVIGAQILVSGFWIVQHMPDDHQDGPTDGDHGSGLAAASGDASVPGCQESVCLGGADGGFAQDARQVGVAMPGRSAAFGLARR